MFFDRMIASSVPQMHPWPAAEADAEYAVPSSTSVS